MTVGGGVYTIGEVARYTSVPTATVRSWFKTRLDLRGHSPLFQSDYEPVGQDFAVSFLNLVDVYVASFFRNNGVKPKFIRRAHEILRDEFHTPHPFSHRELSTDGLKIIREKATGNRDSKFIDVITKQELFPQFKSRLIRINYSQSTNLADCWNIDDGIMIDPLRGWGKPVLEKTSVSTLIIANQYQANGSDAALVARLFKINESAVRNAVKFETRIKRIAA